MEDRVFPSSKPSIPQPPAAKFLSYQTPPKHHKPRRSICCSLFLSILLILLIVFAVVVGIFYLIYHPHRPDFTVSSLRLSQLNLTASNSLTSHLDLSVTARNPNKKISFIYNPISISVFTANGISIGSASFPGFVQGAKNTTVLKTAVSSQAESHVDSTAAVALKKESKIPLEIEMDTKAGVRFGKMKPKKVGIRVKCTEVDVSVPKGKKEGVFVATSVDVRCKVKLRMKIWKWTI